MNRRYFLQVLGCGCLSIGLTSCTTVAITDRKQLKLIPESTLNAKAAKIYEEVKKKEKLSSDNIKLNEIKEIGKKMEYSINEYFERSNLENPTQGFDWEYILIDNDKVKNAWCMPGGKIAFYSGILPIAKNDDGIASIMGHEIAHAVARHSAERMSRAMLIDTGKYALETFVLGQRLPSISGQLRTYGLDLPFNRSQESEADYLGIIFSNLGGYNIDESYKIWERMQEAGGKGPAEFFSTHPSSKNRIIKLKEWIPQVRIDYPSIKA